MPGPALIALGLLALSQAQAIAQPCPGRPVRFIVPMRVAGIAHAGMTDALDRSWQGRDSHSCLLLQLERAGLDIKVPAEEIEAVLTRDG